MRVPVSEANDLNYLFNALVWFYLIFNLMALTINPGAYLMNDAGIWPIKHGMPIMENESMKLAKSS